MLDRGHSMRTAVMTILTVMVCFGVANAGTSETRSATMPSVKLSPKKLTAAATQVAAAATQSSSPTTFPTPAELIAKMRAARKSVDSLPHVAYFNISHDIV